MSESQSNVDIALGVQEGRVVMRWHEPTTIIQFDPQNAFELGEAIARAAHEARFGEVAPADGSYIANQVRARITGEIHDRLVIRASLMLNSLRSSKQTNGEVALQLVDVILAEVG